MQLLGGDVDALSGELDAHPVGVGRDVVVPRGIPRAAARRRDDEPRVALAGEPSHRGHPLDAGLLPDRDEHQLVPAPVALPAEAIGHPLVAPALEPVTTRLACPSGSVRSIECHASPPSGGDPSLNHRVACRAKREPNERLLIIDPEPDDQEARRIELTLRKPWFALYARIKPTLVIDGRGRRPSGESARGRCRQTRRWSAGCSGSTGRDGSAVPSSPRAASSAALVYRASARPFLRGRIRTNARPSACDPTHRGRPGLATAPRRSP